MRVLLLLWENPSGNFFQLIFWPNILFSRGNSLIGFPWYWKAAFFPFIKKLPPRDSSGFYPHRDSSQKLGRPCGLGKKALRDTHTPCCLLGQFSLTPATPHVGERRAPWPTRVQNLCFPLGAKTGGKGLHILGGHKRHTQCS